MWLKWGMAQLNLILFQSNQHKCPFPLHSWCNCREQWLVFSLTCWFNSSSCTKNMLLHILRLACCFFFFYQCKLYHTGIQWPSASKKKKKRGHTQCSSTEEDSRVYCSWEDVYSRALSQAANITFKCIYMYIQSCPTLITKINKTN